MYTTGNNVYATPFFLLAHHTVHNNNIKHCTIEGIFRRVLLVTIRHVMIDVNVNIGKNVMKKRNVDDFVGL